MMAVRRGFGIDGRAIWLSPILNALLLFNLPFVHYSTRISAHSGTLTPIRHGVGTRYWWWLPRISGARLLAAQILLISLADFIRHPPTKVVADLLGTDIDRT
jgi:hypothetical protein